jgi:hypothetical protein
VSNKNVFVTSQSEQLLRKKKIEDDDYNKKLHELENRKVFELSMKLKLNKLYQEKVNNHSEIQLKLKEDVVNKYGQTINKI